MTADLEPDSQPEEANESGRGYPGFFSSASAVSLPVGSQVSADGLGGYYIDFSLKPRTPSWPPYWLDPPGQELFVAVIQWGLGCYERHLAGAGEPWLRGALDACEYLLEHQLRDGRAAGGWVHGRAVSHTYRLAAGWISAMAQGEGASLLLRAHSETGDERYAEAALLALRPLGLAVADGGLRAALGDGWFLEEYPTDPPSLVLNGGIFALWGYRDAAVGLDDGGARREFEAGLSALAGNIGRWDTGSWSRYDLYPHRVVNVASSFYHSLHIDQLRAMQLIAPSPQLEAAARSFERYRDSRSKRVEAFARKAGFRLLVPRNGRLAALTRGRR